MANEIKYGDLIHLLNGYNDWAGGYLDTNGHRPAPAKYGVSTADTPTRGPGTGTWEVLSAEGKADGTAVISGDVVYLRNLYQDDGGYLDTNGHASDDQKRSGGRYDVSTSPGKDRGEGTGRWRIFAQTSSPTDQAVRLGDVLLLRNLYGSGSFLETNSTAGPGLYDVCTNAYFNRAEDVTLWKALTAEA
ncbi:hypothetical protein VSQ78_03655 [Nocardiopsis alba]|uniref:Uncharacterized protein n=1 Tax=Nocardiopsis alba TaxID=53437 RepID=A0ABV5DQD6_9ACTN